MRSDIVYCTLSLPLPHLVSRVGITVPSIDLTRERLWPYTSKSHLPWVQSISFNGTLVVVAKSEKGRKEKIIIAMDNLKLARCIYLGYSTIEQHSRCGRLTGSSMVYSIAQR